MSFDKLNERQQQFVLHYMESGNATYSAKAAGYSERTAHQIGHEQLKKPDVQNAIKEKHDEMDKWLRQQFKRAATDAYKVIKEIADNPEAAERDRLNAAKDLLDRAGHKPKDIQEITGADGADLVIKFVDPE